MPLPPSNYRGITKLVWRRNVVMVKEGMDTSDVCCNATDDEADDALQETEGDLSPAEITQEIESMNDKHKDARVALFWIGRGDAEPWKWEATKTLDKQQHVGLVSRSLFGQSEVSEL